MLPYDHRAYDRVILYLENNVEFIGFGDSCFPALIDPIIYEHKIKLWNKHRGLIKYDLITSLLWVNVLLSIKIITLVLS